MISFRALVVLAGGLLALGTAAAAEPLRAMPGAPFQAPSSPVAKKQLRLAVDAPYRLVALDAVTAAEQADFARTAAVTDKRMPLQIGFARPVPGGMGQIDLADLAWQSMGDGSRSARIVVESPSAAALRAELLLTGDTNGGLTFRFSGNAPGAQVFGPLSWTELEASSRWTPVLEGSAAIIDIELAPGVQPGGRLLAVSRVSHLTVSGAGLAPEPQKKRAAEIGNSGRCNIDLACIPNPSSELLLAAASVAKIVFTDGGRSYLCSGSLLNSLDTPGTSPQIPYFLTANHCIGTAASASSINFYWFFEAAACDSLAVPNFVVTSGGGSLLYTNYDVDVTLVRMNSNPPQGAFLAGWDASPVFPGEDIFSLHHPNGDLKKYSAGTLAGFGHYCMFVRSDPDFPLDRSKDICTELEGSYLKVNWTQGTTEAGSSGSGIYTIDSAGSYKLRGVLHGGDASCGKPDAPDYFSRLDLAYPAISQYLAGVTQPSAGNNAIEYYNVNLDHYFMTTSPAEVQSVETGGAGPGWVRTGHSFPVGTGTLASTGTATVCRFYGSTEKDPDTNLRLGPNSHFYTADANECAQVQSDRGWTYEGPVLTIAVPAGGSCPVNTIPIFRLYNNGFVNRPLDKGIRINNSNHRYTTSLETYQLMLLQPAYLSVFRGDERSGTDKVDSAAKWSGESTVMCAPVAP